ncbi:MAG: phosphatase PAP2 family protein [Planctomycetes bacterium]|nr:phosphatase PAP2 family protein [Planctomycetota bacterium]
MPRGRLAQAPPPGRDRQPGERPRRRGRGDGLVASGRRGRRRGFRDRLLARRERPVGRFCREDPSYANPLCDDQPPAESFWSPQVSNAFAGAALVCMYHDALDLFGETWSDGIACGTAVAAAATTGLLRIMSDQHWITDVLSGAVVGTAIGVLVPWILHFQGGARPPLTGSDGPTISVLPMSDGNSTLGVSVMGLF